jgi:chloramphenicol O-acetyltransferase
VCGVILTDILVLVLDQIDKSFTVLELSETKFLHQWLPLKSQIDEFMHLYVVQ